MRGLIVISSLLCVSGVAAQCGSMSSGGAVLAGWPSLGRSASGEIAERTFHWVLEYDAGTDAFTTGIIAYQGGIQTLGWFPVTFPADAWIWLQLQLVAQGETSADPCYAIEYVDRFPQLLGFVDGFTTVVDLGWLREDDDGDSVPNLLDPDALVVCAPNPDTAVFSSDDCSWGIPGVGDGQLVFVEPSEVPGLPYVSGGWDDAYGCDMEPAWGGNFTSVTADVGTMQVNPEALAWVADWFRHPSAFGVPNSDKPYQGAYNLLRAGAGGGETAYFSAVWGKRLAYVNNRATSKSNMLAHHSTAVEWHRYVIVQDLVFFQYWRPQNNCWAPIKVFATWDATPAVLSVDGIAWGIASNYIPEGYYPGDVVMETESNTIHGQQRIPHSVTDVTGTWWASMFGSGVGGGSGGGSGGGVTKGEMEQAFFSALQKASAGQAWNNAAAMGQLLGSGADGAGAYLFGSGYNNAGIGAGSAAATAVGGGLDGSGDSVTALLGTDVFGSSQQEALQFTLALPNPSGGANWEYQLSTAPDTETTVGSVLDTLRLIFRLLLSFLCAWQFSMACMRLIIG